MNRHLPVLLLVMLVFTFPSFGQKWKLTRYEAHFGIGTANVFGDIGGAPTQNNMLGLKDFRFKDTGLSFYAGARYKLKANMAIKLNLIYGLARGTDAGSKNLEREISYHASFFEPSVQYEYYFIGDYDRNNATFLYSRRGMINDYRTVTAYAFVGAGGVLSSPKVTFNGRPPIQGEYVKNGSVFSPVIPLGLGVKYAIDRYWSIGFEVGRRFTFTDYIDGFSTNWSSNNDTYYFGVFHAIYKLETDRYGVPLIFKRNRYGGPRR